MFFKFFLKLLFFLISLFNNNSLYSANNFFLVTHDDSDYTKIIKARRKINLIVCGSVFFLAGALFYWTLNESQAIRLGKSYLGWSECLNSKKDSVIKGLQIVRYIFVPGVIVYSAKNALNYFLIQSKRDLIYNGKIFCANRNKPDLMQINNDLPLLKDIYSNGIEKCNHNSLWGNNAYRLQSEYSKFINLLLFLYTPTKFHTILFDKKSNEFKIHVLKTQLIIQKERECYFTDYQKDFDLTEDEEKEYNAKSIELKNQGSELNKIMEELRNFENLENALYTLKIELRDLEESNNDIQKQLCAINGTIEKKYNHQFPPSQVKEEDIIGEFETMNIKFDIKQLKQYISEWNCLIENFSTNKKTISIKGYEIDQNQKNILNNNDKKKSLQLLENSSRDRMTDTSDALGERKSRIIFIRSQLRQKLNDLYVQDREKLNNTNKRVWYCYFPMTLLLIISVIYARYYIYHYGINRYHDWMVKLFYCGVSEKILNFICSNVDNIIILINSFAYLSIFIFMLYANYVSQLFKNIEKMKDLFLYMMRKEGLFLSFLRKDHEDFKTLYTFSEFENVTTVESLFNHVHNMIRVA